MYIYDLVIEVTRRCNASCAHCLRGPSEEKDIPMEWVVELFRNVEGIGTLTFSGGEPSIVPEKIRYIMEAARQRGVDVQNFYIATNAYDVSDDFLWAVTSCWSTCSDNEVSAVNWSNDKFHEENQWEGIRLLSMFKFAGPKNPPVPIGGGSYYRKQEPNVIAEGLGEHIGWATRKHTAYAFEEDELAEGRISGESLYLNVDGFLVHGCDWSYENQEKHTICHVEDDWPTEIENLNKKLLRRSA